MTDPRDIARTDRGGRRRYVGDRLGFITYTTRWIVVPFSEMGNTGREPGHFGENEGRSDGNHEFEFGSVQLDAFATCK